MRFLANLTISLVRLAAGCAILLFAAGIPSYFTQVDKYAVAAAGEGTMPAATLINVYMDGAKISTALMIADAVGDSEKIGKQAEILYNEHPRWRAAGGDEPFFDAFYSTIPPQKNGVSLFSLLSVSERRKKLSEFLGQSGSPLVKNFLGLRSMTSTLLPPAFSAAGAPLDAALLISALLSQSGDFSPSFLKDLSSVLEKMKADTSAKDTFERYCIGLLTLSNDMDWTRLRSLMPQFKNLGEVYDFAKLYKSAPNADFKKVLASGLLLCGDEPACSRYLKGGDLRAWGDFSFAFTHGEGSLNFLLAQDMPVYQNSALAELLAPVCDVFKMRFGASAADMPRLCLALKIILSLFGGYLFIRGLLRIFVRRRDTPNWFSPLAILRGFLEAAIVALTFFILIEPDAFKIKVESGPVPELRFAFEKIVNNIGEDTMKIDTDTATLAAIGSFLVIQFIIYVLCMIRLAAIKRQKLPAKLKLKLLENEDNLFDLGLYVGLAGTVASLVLLTLGVFTASLMAGYTSTLFGILVTAIVKIVHVRRYRAKLLIEAANEQ